MNLYRLTREDESRLISIPVDFDTGSVRLQDNKHYLAVIRYNTNNDNDQDYLLFSASDEYNYSGFHYVHDSLFRAERYTDIVTLSNEDGSAEPVFFSGGFDGSVVPVVRLSIDNNPEIDWNWFAKDESTLPEAYTISLFPNPVDQLLQAKLNFPEQTGVTVMMFDLNGRTIFRRHLETTPYATLNFDTANLPSGSYTLRIETPLGIRTQKIVVQH